MLFERPVPLDALADALREFEVVNRSDEVTDWAFGGSSLSLAFRPEVNGYVSVDTVDRPWPDHMGDPKTDPMLFGAWSMGHFGPFTFPNGLSRAALVELAGRKDDREPTPRIRPSPRELRVRERVG